MPSARNLPAWMRPVEEQPAIAAHIEQRLIENQSRIISALGKEPLLVYGYLCQQYQVGFVDQNLLFQFVYRAYYGLDRAGLSDTFKSEYFKLMEVARRKQGKVDIKALAEQLRQFKATRSYKNDGEPELREVEVFPFSFLTKLASTVNIHYPICDQYVGDVLGFDTENLGKTWEERLDKGLRIYTWLRDLYETLLPRVQIQLSLIALSARYSVVLPDAKALDFLLWQAGKLGIVAAP